MLKIEECLNQYKIVTVDSFLETKIKTGSLLNNIYNEDVIIFKNKNNQILALYKIYEKDKSKIKPWKMF